MGLGGEEMNLLKGEVFLTTILVKLRNEEFNELIRDLLYNLKHQIWSLLHRCETQIEAMIDEGLPTCLSLQEEPCSFKISD